MAAGTASVTKERVLVIQPASRHTLHCYSQGRVFEYGDLQRAFTVPHVVNGHLNTTGRSEAGYCLVVAINIDVQRRHTYQLGRITGGLRDALGYEELAYQFGPEHPRANLPHVLTLRQWAASLER